MVQVVCNPCIVCKKRAEVQLTDREWYQYSHGVSLDVAVPRLSLADRELLISGTHDKCWDELFPEEDEEGPECPGCKKAEAFLDDPMTIALGVGSEMLPLFKHKCSNV